ncbi:uncharacterized protein KY384_003010 [Bacidia gigantensis]|uniref:uncharacterized protein n=1 Tax=Bacidia gigantensis TaxID=2732470 RepID=UPI001D04E04F|nr:uncharacterized protein KY384_003010 [Bacidia gigantensis]KAG8531381.1 hypothetical protein KY384_003010 [Bacidia gigantensis]
MVVNYSKWDNLELSDDSDIEVHPNVDKKSFIRAKQNQIHMERDKRRHEIKTLKYERKVNDGLLERIDALLLAFRAHASQAVGANPHDFVMNAIMDTALPPEQDSPPQPPEDVHYKTTQPKYSEMIAGLVDQVKKELDLDGHEWYQKYLEGISAHKTKVQGLQNDLFARLAELEKEEASKITSDNMHDGFSTSSIAKDKPKAEPKPKKKGKVESVEVLNPAAAKKAKLQRLDSGGQTSGADADVDEPEDEADDQDEEFEVTELGKQFAKIKIGNYQDCLRFIAEHPEVTQEKETDGLLVQAFTALEEGKGTYAKQCVHQGLLLQYCRTLGRDGIAMFFKRITTQGHSARKIFLDDVNTTYNRIESRTAELAKQRAMHPNAEDQGGVEQIQLHAVEPGTQIQVNIPKPGSDEEVEQHARVVFERFPPGLQRAMESGSLDRINEVLGKMSVSEAEEVVEQMGESGMLSMEKGVIDGRTDEGQQKIKELQKGAAAGDKDAAAQLEQLNMESEQIEIADPD